LTRVAVPDRRSGSRWRAAAGRLLALIAPARPDAGGRSTTKEAGRDIAELHALARRAHSGDATAQHALGRAYLDGHGVVRSASEAARWFAQAAASGHAQAKSMLAVMILYGWPATTTASGDLFGDRAGAAKADPAAAARLAAEAAQAGVPEGQALYAYLLATGTGVDEDHAAAEAWYRKALAAADLPQAALGLGVLRMSGNGGPADLVEGAALIGQAASAGLATAIYLLGLMHEGGTGVAQDLGAAASLYRAAAEAGHRPAQARLGLALIEGRGAPADPQDGETWLRRAAVAGDAEAAALLGDLYAHGRDGLPPNYLEAASWYRRAADGGHQLAQRALGMLYLTGAGVPRDPEEAVRLFAAAAAAGDASAKADVGNLVLSGTRTERDLPATMAGWFREAASRGDLVAAYNLAVCHAHGVGVRPDPREAGEWLKVAATGVVNAQYWYARMLSGDDPSMADLPQARAWFRRASDEGYIEATAALAEMLGNGRGGPADPEAALKLYLRAAEAGHVGAMFGAGALLAGGHGLPPNREAAAVWFRRAAEAGHPEAQLMLGRFLLRGFVPARVPDEARGWLQRAAEAGVTDAIQELEAARPCHVA
jgi:TPR repeat protein